MKKIIKLVSVAILITFASQSYAQTFGVRGGLNLATMSNSDINSRVGFQLGVTAEFGINDMISIEPALMFDNKGARRKESGVTGIVRTNYLTLPVDVKVGFNLAGLDFYAKVGPYAGLGLFGKTVGKYDGDKITSNIDWGSGDGDYLKRFDFGLNIGAGLKFDKIEVGLTYGLGLIDISAHGNDVKNRVFSVVVGYKL